MRPRVIIVVLALLMTSCGVSSGDQGTAYRCFEGADLHQLIAAENPPQLQKSAWTTSLSEVTSENRLFDGMQETDLPPETPNTIGGSLCRRLKAQLASRCEAKHFWIGTESCAGYFEPPTQAVTASNGTYKYRPVSGHVALVSSRTQDGKLKVVLITTEWKH